MAPDVKEAFEKLKLSIPNGYVSLDYTTQRYSNNHFEEGWKAYGAEINIFSKICLNPMDAVNDLLYKAAMSEVTH